MDLRTAVAMMRSKDGVLVTSTWMDHDIQRGDVLIKTVQGTVVAANVIDDLEGYFFEDHDVVATIEHLPEQITVFSLSQFPAQESE